jgi:hypothetical protein
MDRFGNKLKGGEHISTPIHDILHRFTPLSYLNTTRGAKKGGGTFLEGPRQGLFNFLGVPAEQLRDPKTTAALGTKDWEQSLPKPEEIQFRYHLALQRLPQMAKAMKLSGPQVSQWRHDLEMKAELDAWQYHYAQSKGANSIRSLPPRNRAEAAVQFLKQYKIIGPQEAAANLADIRSVKDDGTLSTLASALWASSGIGAVASANEDAYKAAQPPTLTPGR